MKIYKYALEITDDQVIPMGRSAKPLAAHMQHGTLCLWVLVDPEEDKIIKMHVRVVGTGHTTEVDPETFVSTVIDGAMVWHVFVS